MHFLIFSVFCSVAVSVLLKAARSHGLDMRQAIAVNYFVAVLLVAIVLRPASTGLHVPSLSTPWHGVPWLLLAILLPTIFWALAESVRRVGVARTDAAQRLSLVLPLLAAFTFFGEPFTGRKAFGLLLGLGAVVLLLGRDAGDARHEPANWLWPLAVFVGMGVIDILFKRVAQTGGLAFAQVLLLIFIASGLVSLLALAVLWMRGALRPRWKDLATGVPLGILNFGNILFYIRAHQALPRDPALVFSAMNIGVMAVGALAGVALFRERLGVSGRWGLGVAVVAVLVLTGA